MGPYSYPIPFPNSVQFFAPVVTLTAEGPNAAAAGDNVIMLSSQKPPTSTQFWVWNNALSPTGSASNVASGFNWLAIGF